MRLQKVYIQVLQVFSEGGKAMLKRKGDMNFFSAKTIIAIVSLVVILTLMWPKLGIAKNTLFDLLGIGEKCLESEKTLKQYEEEIDEAIKTKKLSEATTLYEEYKQCFPDKANPDFQIEIVLSYNRYALFGNSIIISDEKGMQQIEEATKNLKNKINNEAIKDVKLKENLALTILSQATYYYRNKQYDNALTKYIEVLPLYKELNKHDKIDYILDGDEGIFELVDNLLEVDRKNERVIIALETYIDYAEGEKEATALYRLGSFYEFNLNNNAAAIKTYQRIVKGYPTSSWALVAKEGLARLQ